MIEISFWKICVVLVVALFVLGPKQLPQVARTAGRLLAQFRRLMNNLTKELDAIEKNSSDTEK